MLAYRLMLWIILHSAFDYYIKEDVNRQSGNKKRRVIWRPNFFARIVQESILDYLRDDVAKHHPMPYANGTRSGCSYVDNALSHRRSRYFYLLDLDSAYPTVTSEMAAGVLCNLDQSLRGNEDEVNAFLARQCFLSPGMIEVCTSRGVKIKPDGLMARELGGLITGGPVAPFLFDLTLSVLIDDPIERVLNTWFGGRKDEWVYTRYIDDITISFKSHQIAKNPYL